MCGYDDNGDRVVITALRPTIRGESLVVVRMAKKPSEGYIALVSDVRVFTQPRHDPRPGVAVQNWFGAGHRFRTPRAALRDMMSH